MLHVNYISRLGEINRLLNNPTFMKRKKNVYISYIESKVSLMIKCTIFIHREDTNQKMLPIKP